MADNFKKLIVALDFENEQDIERAVKALKSKKVKFKIGSIAFTKFGPKLVKGLVKKGADIFLDLKLYDIPNTMKNTAGVITDLGCWAFTVHAKAGKEALSAVKEEVAMRAQKNKMKKPLILAVTELTSTHATLDQVLNLANSAKNAGLDGVIASAQEASALKARLGQSFKLVTPGIRSPKDQAADQKRVTTAKQAFAAGADFIVVGRPIIDKPNYLKAAKEILMY